MRIRLNSCDVTPVGIGNDGHRVRVILHVPLNAIPAVKKGATHHELTLDLLDVGPLAASFLVSALDGATKGAQPS